MIRILNRKSNLFDDVAVLVEVSKVYFFVRFRFRSIGLQKWWFRHYMDSPVSKFLIFEFASGSKKVNG